MLFSSGRFFKIGSPLRIDLSNGVYSVILLVFFVNIVMKIEIAFIVHVLTYRIFTAMLWFMFWISIGQPTLMVLFRFEWDVQEEEV